MVYVYTRFINNKCRNILLFIECLLIVRWSFVDIRWSFVGRVLIVRLLCIMVVRWSWTDCWLIVHWSLFDRTLVVGWSLFDRWLVVGWSFVDRFESNTSILNTPLSTKSTHNVCIWRILTKATESNMSLTLESPRPWHATSSHMSFPWQV